MRKPEEPVTHAFMEEAMRAGMGGFAEVAAQLLWRLDKRQSELQKANAETSGQVKEFQAQVTQFHANAKSLQKQM